MSSQRGLYSVLILIAFANVAFADENLESGCLADSPLATGDFQWTTGPPLFELTSSPASRIGKFFE